MFSKLLNNSSPIFYSLAILGVLIVLSCGKDKTLTTSPEVNYSSTTEDTIRAAKVVVSSWSDITNLVLTATDSSITATWDAVVAPSNSVEVPPKDHRVRWKKTSDASYPSWKDANGNAYPTSNSYTINDLECGISYSVEVRARFNGWSGDWTEASASTLACEDDSSESGTSEPESGDSDTNESNSGDSESRDSEGTTTGNSGRSVSSDDDKDKEDKNNNNAARNTNNAPWINVRGKPVPTDLAQRPKYSYFQGYTLRTFSVQVGDTDGDVLTTTVTGLPAGLSYSPTGGTWNSHPTGNISGKISRNATVQEYTVTISVSDGTATTVRTITFEVKGDILPSISALETKSYVRGQAIDAFDIEVGDLNEDRMIITIDGLPHGLRLSGRGSSTTVRATEHVVITVEGTISLNARTGEHVVTVKATTASSISQSNDTNTYSAQFSIFVGPVISGLPDTLFVRHGLEISPISISVDHTHTYPATLSATGLPDGLTLSNGEITGTPLTTANPASYNVRITANVDNGASNYRDFVVTVQDVTGTTTISTSPTSELNRIRVSANWLYWVIERNDYERPTSIAENHVNGSAAVDFNFSNIPNLPEDDYILYDIDFADETTLPPVLNNRSLDIQGSLGAGPTSVVSTSDLVFINDDCRSIHQHVDFIATLRHIKNRNELHGQRTLNARISFIDDDNNACVPPPPQVETTPPVIISSLGGDIGFMKLWYHLGRMTLPPLDYRLRIDAGKEKTERFSVTFPNFAEEFDVEAKITGGTGFRFDGGTDTKMMKTDSRRRLRFHLYAGHELDPPTGRNFRTSNWHYNRYRIDYRLTKPGKPTFTAHNYVYLFHPQGPFHGEHAINVDFVGGSTIVEGVPTDITLSVNSKRNLGLDADVTLRMAYPIAANSRELPANNSDIILPSEVPITIKADRTMSVTATFPDVTAILDNIYESTEYLNIEVVRKGKVVGRSNLRITDSDDSGFIMSSGSYRDTITSRPDNWRVRVPVYAGISGMPLYNDSNNITIKLLSRPDDQTNVTVEFYEDFTGIYNFGGRIFEFNSSNWNSPQSMSITRTVSRNKNEYFPAYVKFQVRVAGNTSYTDDIRGNSYYPMWDDIRMNSSYSGTGRPEIVNGKADMYSALVRAEEDTRLKLETNRVPGYFRVAAYTQPTDNVYVDFAEFTIQDQQSWDVGFGQSNKKGPSVTAKNWFTDNKCVTVAYQYGGSRHEQKSEHGTASGNTVRFDFSPDLLFSKITERSGTASVVIGGCSD